MTQIKRVFSFCLLAVFSLTFLIPQSFIYARGDAPGPVMVFPGQIAFVGADYNVWLVQGGTGERFRLTQDGSKEGMNYYSPVFSPDGSRLVYINRKYNQTDSAVYLMTSANGPAQKIGSGWDLGARPWSPDGKKLVYTNAVMMGEQRDPNKAYGVWVYDLAEGQSTLLQQSGNQQAFYDASWSPDGKYINFRDYCFECVGQFMTYDLARGIRYEWSLTDRVHWVGYGTDWSPDGSQVAYDQWDYYNPPDATYGLWTGQADGQNQRMIYSAEGRSVNYPKWSPDGRKIAFNLVKTVQNQGYQRTSDLMLVSPDGSNPETLYQGSAELSLLAWSPDSKKLLFSRPGGEYQAASLMVYDLEKRAAFKIGEDQVYNAADWSRAAETVFGAPAEKEVQTTAWTVRPPFALGKNALLYLAADQSLVIFDNLSRDSIPLTNKNAAARFSLSPSQRRVYAQNAGSGYLLDLEPKLGGEIAVSYRGLSQQQTDNTYFGKNPSFSPGDSYFTYTDTLNRVWVVTRGGQEAQLPYSLSVPSWSYDDQWMSFLTLDRRLVVSHTGGPYQVIAEGVEPGSERWSPTQHWLAFDLGETTGMTLFEQERDTRKTMLFNADTGYTGQVFDGAGTDSWARDGRVLAVQRMDSIGASAYSWTNFLVDVVTMHWQEVGSYYSRGANRWGWTDTDEAYIYGSYKASKDMTAVSSIAPALLAASTNGHTFLSLENTSDAGMNETGQVYCWDDRQGGRAKVADLTIGPLYGAVMPGIWGRLSDDGKWAVVQYYQESGTHLMITRCDGLAQAEGAPENTSNFYTATRSYTFSTGSDWLASMTQDGNNSFLQLRGLSENGIGASMNLPAAQDGAVFWLDRLSFPVAPTATPLPTQTPTPLPTPTEQPVVAAATAAVTQPAAVALPAAVTQPAAVTLPAAQQPASTLPPALPAQATPAPAANPGGQTRLVQALETLAIAFFCLFGLGVLVAALWLIIRRGNRTVKREVSALVVEQAILLIRAGNHQKAFDILHTYVDKNPNDAAAWYWMGAAAQGLGQPRTAQRCFARAKKLGYEAGEMIQRVS